MTVRALARRGAGFCVLGWLFAGHPAPRLLAQPPGPAQVFTREQLRQSGRTGLAEILQSLDPAFNAPRPSNAGGTDHAPPLTLHGLGADQLLVLINGRRRHPSALIHVDATIGRGQGMVDLGSIPLSAIERIELYASGEAARFGFGAVSGVLNIVLRARAEAELSGALGLTTSGDGAVLAAGGSHAFGLGADGFLQLSADLRARGGTNRALADQRPQYFLGDPRNSDPALTRPVTSHLGDPDTRELGTFFHAVKPLRGSLEAYGFGGLSYRRSEAGELWRRPSDDRTVRALYPHGFLPELAPRFKDGSALAGLRGALHRWRYDLSVGYGRSSLRYQVEHTVNTSLGQQSPTSFEAGSLRADQFTTGLELARRFALPAIPPLELTLGASYRSEGYQIRPGTPDSYRFGAVPILDGPHAEGLAAPGAQGFPGFRPNDAVTARRGSVALFGGASTTLFRRLALRADGRFESYPESGWEGVYQLAARLEPVEGLILRASHGTGARPPALGQAWYSRTVTTIIGNSGFDELLVPARAPVAVVLGARPLALERSSQSGAGATLHPVGALSLSADYFQVEVRDRIILSGSIDDPLIQAFLTQRNFGGIRSVRFFNNALATRTSGVDAAAGYQVALRGAELRLEVRFSHTSTRITRVDSLPGLLSQFKQLFLDRTERTRIEQGQPRDNLMLSAALARRRWAVEARAQRYGSVRSAGAPANGSLDQRFGAGWIADLSVRYRPRERLTLRLGADNLFNGHPERNNTGDANVEGNSHYGIFPYHNSAPLGFNGRLLSLRAVWSY